MADTLLKKEIAVYSDKNNIHGIIRDYGMVTKLFFTYKGKEIVMGVRRNVLDNESFEELGRNTIDSYIANLAAEDERKLMLHYWYIDEKAFGDMTYRIAHGIVTGHRSIPDSVDAHTSEVKAVHVDEAEEELILITENSVYHCPLSYCRFSKQDQFPDIIPDYEEIKDKYIDTINYPTIEQGKVLLVLADFCEYYFHSLYYVPKESKPGQKRDYCGSPHIGMFQDSFLVHTEDYCVDLRYFPHYQNIEFYRETSDGCPLYLENIGNVVIYADTHVGIIKLQPGERKEVSKENIVDPQALTLPIGDLYPAGIIEFE